MGGAQPPGTAAGLPHWSGYEVTPGSGEAMVSLPWRSRCSDVGLQQPGGWELRGCQHFLLCLLPCLLLSLVLSVALSLLLSERCACC